MARQKMQLTSAHLGAQVEVQGPCSHEFQGQVTCRALHKQQVGTVALADIRTAVSMASVAAAALFPVLSNLKRESARVARDGIYEEMPPIRQGFLF